MTATAAMRAELRRMTDLAADDATYDDDTLDTYIERYPLVDERGVAPYYYDTTTTPPTQTATTGWYPTYDLHSAAADLWEEQAAALAPEVDHPTETGTYAYSQRYAHALKQARYHRSRRTARTAKLIPWPSRNRRGDSYVGNLPEE